MNIASFDKAVIDEFVQMKSKIKALQTEYSSALEEKASDLDIEKGSLSAAVDAVYSGTIRKKAKQSSEVEELLVNYTSN